MSRAYRATGAVLAVGCLLLFAPGCSKSLEGTSGSKTMEQRAVKPLEQEAVKPLEQEAVKPPAPAPVTLPGEERVADEIVVAKAEPSSEAAQTSKQRSQEMQMEQAATAGAGLQDVFFGFDSWTINDSGKQALGEDAQWLKANAGKSLTIEGHCDERGTQAYNLVLGEKRAKAVRSYLVDLGVDAKRLAVTSYGKDRPFCRERSEDCYQQNRRGHLVLRVK